MAGKSDYLEDAVLNHVLRATAFASPADVYVGLYTVAPTDAGGGTEVSEIGYVRQVCVFDAPVAGVCSNPSTVVFPVAGEDWGRVVAFGVFDVIAAGNLLYWNVLGTPRDCDFGEQVGFAPGVLNIHED